MSIEKFTAQPITLHAFVHAPLQLYVTSHHITYDCETFNCI
jgi:hypothetical protein